LLTKHLKEVHGLVVEKAKTQREWDKLVIVTEHCPPFPKPALVKLALEQLLQVLGLNAWGVGNMPQDATSHMEKYEDLQKMTRSTRFVYARQLKMAWDVKNWDQKSSKISQTK
jgi:hypothetical protein